MPSNGRKKQPTASKKKHADRLRDEVEQMMFLGITPNMIVHTLASEHKVTDRTIQRYVKEVKEKWGNNPNLTIWMNTYRKAITDGRHNAAATVLQKMQKLRIAQNVDVDRYSKLGPPPKDPLKRNDYAQNAMTIALHETMNDASLPPEQRRDEMRKIVRTIAALTPNVSIYAAQESIKEDAAMLNTDDVDAMLEDYDSNKKPVRAKRKRGRPRKQ